MRKGEGEEREEKGERTSGTSDITGIFQFRSTLNYLAMDSYHTRPKLLDRKQPFTDTDSTPGYISFQVPYAKGWASC